MTPVSPLNVVSDLIPPAGSAPPSRDGDAFQDVLSRETLSREAAVPNGDVKPSPTAPAERQVDVTPEDTDRPPAALTAIDGDHAGAQVAATVSNDEGPVLDGLDDDSPVPEGAELPLSDLSGSVLPFLPLDNVTLPQGLPAADSGDSHTGEEPLLGAAVLNALPNREVATVSVVDVPAEPELETAGAEGAKALSSKASGVPQSDPNLLAVSVGLEAGDTLDGEQPSLDDLGAAVRRPTRAEPLSNPLTSSAPAADIASSFNTLIAKPIAANAAVQATGAADISVRGGRREAPRLEPAAATERSADTNAIASTPVLLPTLTSKDAIGGVVHLQHAMSMGADMAQRLTWMMSQGVTSAEIAVSPKELGPLAVALEHKGGEVFVSLVAANPHARELLESSLPRLRDALTEQGVALGGLDVRGGHSQSGEQSGERGGSDRRWQQAAGNGDRSYVSTQLLDIFA